MSNSCAASLRHLQFPLSLSLTARRDKMSRSTLPPPLAVKRRACSARAQSSPAAPFSFKHTLSVPRNQACNPPAEAHSRIQRLNVLGMQTFSRTLLSVLLLALPAVVQAQWQYTV